MAMTKAERAAKRAERAAQKARMEKAEAETRAIVATGKCPCCGSRVRRNSAITGWWQCEQYGAVGFRARSADPACSWQGFTQ